MSSRSYSVRIELRISGLEFTLILALETEIGYRRNNIADRMLACHFVQNLKSPFQGRIYFVESILGTNGSKVNLEIVYPLNLHHRDEVMLRVASS